MYGTILFFALLTFLVTNWKKFLIFFREFFLDS